jgi:hypothetical protein
MKTSQPSSHNDADQRLAACRSFDPQVLDHSVCHLAVLTSEPRFAPAVSAVRIQSKHGKQWPVSSVHSLSITSSASYMFHACVVRIRGVVPPNLRASFHISSFSAACFPFYFRTGGVAAFCGNMTRETSGLDEQTILSVISALDDKGLHLNSPRLDANWELAGMPASGDTSNYYLSGTTSHLGPCQSFILIKPVLKVQISLTLSLNLIHSTHVTSFNSSPLSSAEPHFSDLIFKMPLCRFHPARQCVCDGTLVKLRRGAKIPMLIDTPQGQWSLSPRAMRETWPALMDDFQRSGNRRLNPLNRFGAGFTNINDIYFEGLAWEYFASRLAHLEHESRFGPQPLVYGLDPDNPLYDLYDKAKFALRNQGPAACVNILGIALGLFERICDRLVGSDKYGQWGFGRGMYMEVIEMARLFAPMISQFSPVGIYSLLTSLWKMVSGDDFTLMRVTDQIDAQSQQALLNIAQNDYYTNGSLAAVDIYNVLL